MWLRALRNAAVDAAIVAHLASEDTMGNITEVPKKFRRASSDQSCIAASVSLELPPLGGDVTVPDIKVLTELNPNRCVYMRLTGENVKYLQDVAKSIADSTFTGDLPTARQKRSQEERVVSKSMAVKADYRRKSLKIVQQCRRQGDDKKRKYEELERHQQR